ncbi:MAG: methylated-DNA--[protein]-cysteine S-methyltransferase [Anaerolineaceae bacterium]|nr:methylated-DNA--[protein]-cysteine S-methyltransferase [Anaerolineaceae bacterium]
MNGNAVATGVEQSRERVRDWFSRTAPLVEWSEMDSPLGVLYLAQSGAGLCRLTFGGTEDDFRALLPSRAKSRRNPDSLREARKQLDAYFGGSRVRFRLPVDLGEMTRFQQRVLRRASAIPGGGLRSYGHIARGVGAPRASRPVGQALGRNPVPVVVPCHRVVGSDGKLTGYSGASGIESKRWLLRLEGAPVEAAARV